MQEGWQMGTAKKVVIAGLLALVVGASWVTANPVREGQRELIESPNGRLIAMIPDRPDWCQDEVTVTVYGDDDALFKDDRIELQRLLGLVRATMTLECPQVKRIVMNGFVDDVFLFRGFASKDHPQGDWILIEIPPGLVAKPPEPLPPPPMAKKVPSPDSIAACDRLAAHPDDPTKPRGVPGVGDDDMHAGDAVQQCEDALELAPDNPRIRYQLARAYLMFDKVDEGITLMTEAAEEGHAAAMSSLGDIALYGLLGDEPDPETAKALYLKAAAAGFKPADGFAKAIVADPKEEKEEAPAPPELHRPGWADVVTTGKPIASFQPLPHMMVYSLHFIAGVKEQCPGSGIALNEQSLMRTASKHLGGWLGAMNWGAAISEGGYDAERQQGMDDGYAIAVTTGCDSTEVQSARRTVQNFFSN